MSDRKSALLKHLRAVVCLLLVALYILGLIAMMTFSFQIGLILWVVSTLGGLGLLYWVRTMEKRAEEAAKAEAEAAGPRSDGEATPEARDDA